MSRVVRSAAVLDYPCSDDQPMAESEFQLIPMLYLLTVLRTHYRDRPHVYVGGNMFVYYEEGNPGAVVAPDVFVVLGADKRAAHPRKSYKLWEEVKGPDFVLEVVSPSTWSVDRDEKRVLYASLGVEEYWLHDPTGEHLAPRLRGMRLAGRGYRDLPAMVTAPGAAALRSGVLGLDVRVDGDGTLRLGDPVTGQDLLGHDEAVAAHQEAVAAHQEAVAAHQEADAAREAAEAQVAELRALLRDLQSGRIPPGDRK